MRLLLQPSARLSAPRWCRILGIEAMLIGLASFAGPLLYAQGLDWRSYERLYAREPNRHALVIGNPTYENLAPLSNANIDAREMATRLETLGFNVTLEPALPSRRDLTERILPQFRQRIQPGDIVIFYYSGHGFAFGQSNYIAPANLSLQVEQTRVDRIAVAVEGIESFIAEVEPSIVVLLLDACRTVPGFQIVDNTGANTIAKSIAMPMDPPSEVGVLFGFPTRPGRIALAYTDGTRLSPFTDGLLKVIGRPGEEFVSSYKDVIHEVRTATGGEQLPGIYVYSEADLFLAPTPLVAEAQRTAFGAALSSNEPSAAQHFVSRFATSRYAPAARQWLADQAWRGLALEYTYISPIAVERAWYVRDANILRTTTGLAYTRAVEQSATLAAGALNDPELGVTRSRQDPDTNPESRSQREIAAAVAHGTVVTIVPLVVFSQPSAEAVPLATLEAGSILELESVAGAGSRWIRATSPTVDSPFFFEMPSGGASSAVDIGAPLKESVFNPVASGPTTLVDSAEVATSVADLQKTARILWVSIATGPTGDPSEDAARTLRRTHVENLLKQSGIDHRRITAVAGAADMEGDGVRVRFFGYLR